MAIADIAKAAAEATPEGVCQVCRALTELPGPEAQGLRDLMSNPRVQYTKISQWISEDEDNPLTIHSDIIGKHARGRCAAREKLRGA